MLNALALYRRLFSNRGVQRGFTPLPGDWGIKGVEKGLINDLSI